MNARTARLGDICDINPRASKPLRDDTSVSFLSMSSVSEDGFIEDEKERKAGEVKKGYTPFERGDVLVAKITPCFENGKATRTTSLRHPVGFGSTEFHVLRASNEALPDYIFHTVWNSGFRKVGTKNMTGSAGQKRVPADFLRSLEIPLPPLDEQRRIAAILDKADALRRKRKRALELLDGLTQSIFLEMFGNSEVNSHRFPERPLETVLAIQPNFGSMISPTKERREWISLRVANIQDWALTLADSKFIDLPQEAIHRHTLIDGDIILARAIASEEHLGKCVVVEPAGQKWAFDSHLMRIRLNPDLMLPVYLRELFRTPHGRHLFLRSTRKTTVQFNINTKELSALKVPVPPIARQLEFVDRITQLTTIQHSHKSALMGLDQMLASLQHRAFSGQL